MRPGTSLTLLSGPDGLARYTYILAWDDPRRATCSYCGAGTAIGADGLIYCGGYPGATPPRGCCAAGQGVASMPRGQVFFATLPDDMHLRIGDSAATMRLLCGADIRDSCWTQSPAGVTCLACLAAPPIR